MNKMVKMMLGMLAMVLVFGCKTVIPVTYTEPARLNMSGINRLAIESNNQDATAYISQQLTRTGKFAVATPAELQELRQWQRANAELAALDAIQKRAAEITPANLVREYTANAARADSNYGGNVLKITGPVTEIIQDGRGRFVVRLAVDNDAVDVHFRSSEASQIASLDRGQEITFFGTCNGFRLPDMEDTAEILRILGAGRRVNIIDATFPVTLVEYPGKIDAVVLLNASAETINTSRIVSRSFTDEYGQTIVRDVPIYERAVTVTINYNIEKIPGSTSIGNGTKTETSPKSSNEDRSKLPDPAALAAQTINKPLQELANEMVPMERSLSVTLVNSDSKIKEVKSASKAALNQVKAKDYAGAATAFGRIFAQHNDFAAGYNQAVLTEVVLGTEEAIVLMDALAKSTNNPMAQMMLADMQRRNAANQQAAQQLAQ